MIKKVYKIQGMDCDSCAKMIELDMEDIGVKASCSYPKGELLVEYDAKKIDEKRLFDVIQTAGYSLSIFNK